MIMEPTTFRIRVKSLDGQILTFHSVASYSVIDGFIHFIDSKTGKEKIFSVSNTEISKED